MISKDTILRRAFRNSCPNCGAKSLFYGWTGINRSCSECGMDFDKEAGFSLGAIPICYTITAIVSIFPLFLLWQLDWLSTTWTLILALLASIIFPLFFYRTSRSWWIGIYYYFLPHELPANQTKQSDKDSFDRRKL